MDYSWWGWLESNQLPSGYEPPALTGELQPHVLARSPWSLASRSQELLTGTSIADFWPKLYNLTCKMFAKIKTYYQKTIQTAEQLRDMRVVGLLLFLVVVLMISWSGVRVIETNYKLQQQIAQLQQQNRVQQLANQNLRLQNQYYDTEQYLEIAARSSFGLAKEGETVLAVPRQTALHYTVEPKEPGAVSEAETKQPAYQRNFQAWMDFFLHRD